MRIWGSWNRHVAGGNIKYYRKFGKLVVPQNVKYRFTTLFSKSFPRDPSKRIKNVHATYTQMFIVALFIIDKKLK